MAAFNWTGNRAFDFSVFDKGKHEYNLSDMALRGDYISVLLQHPEVGERLELPWGPDARLRIVPYEPQLALEDFNPADYTPESRPWAGNEAVGTDIRNANVFHYHDRTPEAQASRVKLWEVFDVFKDHAFQYTYDLGSPWIHIIDLVAREVPTEKFICTYGAGQYV